MTTTTELPTRNLNLNLLPASAIKIKRKIKIKNPLAIAALLAMTAAKGFTAEISLESAPPVVVKTVPVAGATDVDPTLTEIKVTYSKAMQDGSWSWSTWGEGTFPETSGQPRYLPDGRTGVLPVKLEPGKFYATWLNSDKFKNFTDTAGRPAVPYLLTFRTAATTAAGGTMIEREVNKLVGEFPAARDLSTPEGAAAAWQRASAAKDAKVISQLSLIPLDAKEQEDWYAREAKRDAEGLAIYLKAVADSRIVTVQVWREALANVITLLPFPEGKGRQPYSARSFGLINGEWKNLGEDRLPGLDSAKAAFVGKKERLWEQYQQLKAQSGAAIVPQPTTGTAATAAPLPLLPSAEQLPGQLIFQGRYRHRSRGGDIDAPSQLWIKESPGGGLSVLAEVPFMNAKELVVSDQSKRFIRFQSRGKSGYELDLELKDNTVKLSRRGVRQDVDGKVLTVPAGAWFDPNTRPDSYVAANLLLRGFAIGAGETKEFRVYDWDNSGEGLADYTIRVKHAGKEKVEVPAGTFEANHFVLTQVTSADTWFKKRAGHVTDFWVLDNHVIVRVLRHREPYEMLLLDYTVPEKLATANPASTPQTGGGGGGGGEAARLRTATPAMEGIREAWSAAVAAIQREETASALTSLRTLAPRIQEFRDIMKGTSLEAGAAAALEALKPLISALEKGDLEAARTEMQPMLALGQKMEEQIKAIAEATPVPAPEPVAGLPNAVVLKRDDGIQIGVQSIAASGHAVQFQQSDKTRYVEAVQILAARYGTPEPPQDDFHLYLLNEQRQVLADVKFPYSMIERGDPKWYTLRMPSIEVPEKFVVALNFNPHQTKGIYLAYSATNGASCHSQIGLPGDGFEFWKPVEWMVRVSLTAEPTKAKGFQRLADWKPPVAEDSLANSRIASIGGDKSEGQQSYGGRGPAVRFKPAELLPGVRANAPLLLKGVRLYASRYGSGYSPEEAKLRVIVRDANDTTLAANDFAYAKFGYKTGWVDLVFDQPVGIQNANEPVTIALDPEATQFKGIYFHYQKNPATSHSLAGSVASGFKELSDREWMVRACFE